MDDATDDVSVSRRTLLRASAGAAGVSALGTPATADGAAATGTPDWFDDRCPDATLEPTMGHCVEGGMEGCADDHPATRQLRSAVQTALAERYPDVGALIDEGYKPYFDTLDRDDDSYSHWINPEYVGDDAVVDPERPESVLVDDETWRPIGVMFVATSGGERIDPPAVYGGDGDAAASDRPIDGTADPDASCSPWHYHAGLPGRFAWWYYEQAYEGSFTDGEIRLPCRTPCMLHVWAVDHPESVYAHHAPPAEFREDEPADEAGFETDAEPGSDELGWDVLPDELVPAQRPEDLAALVPGL